MDTEITKEYWRLQLFRDIAGFVHEPSTSSRAKLMLLIDSYLYFYGAVQHQGSTHPLDSY